jgi:hypothetical protein
MHWSGKNMDQNLYPKQQDTDIRYAVATDD